MQRKNLTVDLGITFVQIPTTTKCFRAHCYLVTQSCPSLSATPRTVAHQVPLSMGFPRSVYWSSLPFPSPDTSPALAGGFLTTEPPGKPFFRSYKQVHYRETTLIPDKKELCLLDSFIKHFATYITYILSFNVQITSQGVYYSSSLNEKVVMTVFIPKMIQQVGIEAGT